MPSGNTLPVNLFRKIQGYPDKMNVQTYIELLLFNFLPSVKKM